MSKQQRDDPPRGQLFSRVYLERADNLADSERFRTRLAGHFAHHVPYSGDLHGPIARSIKMQLGVEVPSSYYGYLFDKFFESAQIRDVLDSITIVHRTLVAARQTREAREWVENVANIFSAEGLLYSIDEQGGVHRAVDSEFDRNRATAIQALGSSRFRAVADALERAYDKLSQHDRDSKGAVRDCFEATETLAKLVCNTNAALDAGFVKERITPLADRVYGGDPATASTAGRMVSSLADWVNAAHPFRHGQKTEVPTALPDDLAILLISQGASFIRWLTDLDGQVRQT